MSALLPTQINRAAYLAYRERLAQQRVAWQAQRPAMVPHAVYLRVVERCLRLEQRLAEHDER